MWRMGEGTRDFNCGTKTYKPRSCRKFQFLTNGKGDWNPSNLKWDRILMLSIFKMNIIFRWEERVSAAMWRLRLRTLEKNLFSLLTRIIKSLASVYFRAYNKFFVGKGRGGSLAFKCRIEDRIPTLFLNDRRSNTPLDLTGVFWQFQHFRM